MAIRSPPLRSQLSGAADLNLDTAFTEINAGTDAGKWKIVFFWPKDFTFVCPTEIVAFSKMAGDFADRNAMVYGVSINSEFVHLNWRLHHEDLKTLPIPMLTDVKRELATATGVLDKKEGVALRATFVVGPDGIIRFAAVNDLFGRTQPAEVLRVLDALQTDELCPATGTRASRSLRAA